MKIIYCFASLYNPGGIERVLLNKVHWFAAQGGYELMVVTTDQQGRPPFYAFPPEVRMVDLGINYSVDNGRSPLRKILSYFRKRRIHRKRLTELLLRERADVVVSLFPSESSFIPDIPDGSKKVLELHYNRFFRLQYNRSGLLGLADRYRMRQDDRLVRRFDRFVVLTREDAGYWGALPNLAVIPNAAPAVPDVRYNPQSRRVIAVGRLDYQKGFDRLLDAWALIPAATREGWSLDIFGQGEWEQMLREKADRLGIADSARINPPTGRIFDEYARSAFLAMSSHFEGLPMVMIEAMACGLPVVSFDFPCGPKDLIREGENGLLVPEGNLDALASAMARMMSDENLRSSMSVKTAEIPQVYSEEVVMQQWTRCFQNLLI
ncbi:MAG: glycosyltransferase family 4 protein [Bacteroidales bacterium]|nr:glycosyltransferase family 4 protein [Bacteroidales bacterium]